MRILWTLFWFPFLAGTLLAQRAPHLAYVYPAGGRSGTTFQCVVGGQALATVSNVFFSGTGIDAAFVELNRPTNQKEFNSLRDRFRQLQERFQATRRGNPGTNTWTRADAAELEQVRAKLLKNPPNRSANPAMVDVVTMRVSITTNALPGQYEFRLSGSNGLSNPLRFYVGRLDEVTKPTAKPANPDLDRFLANLSGRPVPTGTPKYECRVALPAVLNGQIMPGGVDRYRFAANHGQQLILAVSARQLMPYLADAVPGWFEAVLSICDSQGKELLSGERFRFRPDPLVHFEVPRDGEYTVEIHDSIFRGREDFIYRLTIGEEPFVTGVFPLGGRAGEKTTVALTGWNLAEKSLTFDGTSRESEITVLAGPFINPVPFALDDLPECLEQKPNNTPENAQTVTLPIIVNGRIGTPGQRAVFKFFGRTGQQVVAEVVARRLDSPLDSSLRLTDASGRQLAFNDDFEDKGTGLNTHHADSYLTANLPADGLYYLQLTDTQGQGGPDFAYRLRISEPRPDFALRVVPSSISLRTAMSTPVTVFALRRDGFTNAIDLVLEGAPEGFSLSGARIPAGADKAQITLRAPPQPTENVVAINISGRATIDGKVIRHVVVPCEDMMQAFAYRHLVPSKELAVMVNGLPRPFARDAFKILTGTPVRIARGGTASVKVSTPSNLFLDRFNLELDNPPEGISLEKVSAVANGVELLIRCDAAKVAIGTKANIICSVLPKNRANPSTPRPSGARGVAATFPAIPIEIRGPE
jgi:hypothetical protein